MLAGLLVAALAASANGSAAGHEEVEAGDIGISVMLLGSISFMMSLFYLTNQRDDDLRKYSWQVISSTISIFSAVLLFQAVNGVVHELFLHHASHEVVVTVGFVHMLFWFLALQVVLAVCCSIGRSPKPEIHTVELGLKCWAVLIGHITGFAAIHSFCELQQFMPRTFLGTVSVAPIAWCAIWILGLVTDFVRESIAMLDDGSKDEIEEKWDEETEETEDDIIGLAVSFALVQSLRFSVSGILPNAEGEEPEGSLHSDQQALQLLAISVVFMVMSGVTASQMKASPGRIGSQLRSVASMSFAWCMFYGVNWFLSMHSDASAMQQSVVLALLQTFLALCMIFCLDKMADKESTSYQIQVAIRHIICSLGILIGFSWEKAFDIAVVRVCDPVTLIPPHMMKLLLAIVLASIVIPAWRIHILPTILEFQEAEEKDDEEFDHEAAGHPEPHLAAVPHEAVPHDAEPKGGLSQFLLRKTHGHHGHGHHHEGHGHHGSSSVKRKESRKFMVGLNRLDLQSLVLKYKHQCEELERKLMEVHQG